jgi:hypothetical protein
MLGTRHQAGTSTWQFYQTTKPNWPLTSSLESIGPSRGASTASGSNGGGGGRGVRLGRAVPRRRRVPDLDVPEHPVLRGGAVRHVVGDGVTPRQETERIQDTKRKKGGGSQLTCLGLAKAASSAAAAADPWGRGRGR